MATYLLDANFFINLYDEKATSETRLVALKSVETLLQDEETRFVISPLIRYEVLRGVNWGDEKKLTQLSGIIKQFELLDISREVADLARDLYRFDDYEAKQHNQPKNLEKRKFDMFHYATAKVNGIELLSADAHIEKIDALYERMQQTQTAESHQL